MAVAAHVDKLRESVGAWNAWRRDNPEIEPDLSGFDFGGMDVSGADFRLANLRGAQLGSVIGILPASLAGADLTHAELPAELSKFPGLAHVAEVSRHARVSFLAVIASCVFCWLTIVQTSDGALLANRGAMPLPVINTKVPVTGFFLFAPMILLALYIYLQLFLQRMWDGLSRLPAVFPDGARLDQKVFPWLMSGLVNLYVPRLRKGAPPFTWLQVLLSVVTAWLLVPATIAWFWLGYLRVADGFGIAPHVLLLNLAIAFGVLFYWRAHETLRGRLPALRGAPFAGWLSAPRIVAPLTILVALLGSTVAATYYGHRLSIAHQPLELSGMEIGGTADLDRGSIRNLKRLDLRHLNLRHAKAREAVLLKVDLRQVDLSFSDFASADLRGADLEGADLTRARLIGAKLEGALLANTRLDDADFTGASLLTQQMLVGACGEEVTLPPGLKVKPCESLEVKAAAGGENVPGSLGPGTVGETQVAVAANDWEPGKVFRDCEECPEMVVVPAGEFVMGSPEDEEGREEDEGPRHGVIIAAPFAVGRYEVTRAEYARFVEATGWSEGDRCDIKIGGEWSKQPGKGWRDPGYEQSDQDPVVCVSWNDAKAYAGWLSDKTNKKYRLLTEAEWEYAARAGTSTSYRWGDTIGSNNANCDGCGSQWDDERTAPVGNFDPSRFGLYDTAGNVWEWVEDCWNGSYEDAPTNASAWTTGRCQLRVRRGGSWASNPRKLRPADRHRVDFEDRNHRNGFRVARTLL